MSFTPEVFNHCFVDLAVVQPHTLIGRVRGEVQAQAQHAATRNASRAASHQLSARPTVCARICTCVPMLAGVDGGGSQATRCSPPHADAFADRLSVSVYKGTRMGVGKPQWKKLIA